MAYSTGSGSARTSLMAAIKAFAEAEGWTTDTYTADTRLIMHKGIAFVCIGVEDPTLRIYTGTGGSYTDTVSKVMVATLATAYDSGVSTYHSQTGSPEIHAATVSLDNNRHSAVVRDLDGSLTWWMFSGDGITDPDYIHVVVQTAADRFAHFSFGFLEQKSLTHSGVVYVTGSENKFYQDAATATTCTHNEPAQQFCPFANARGVFYAPDALPIDGVWTTGMASAFLGVSPSYAEGYSNTSVLRTITFCNSQADGYGSSKRLLGSLPWAYPSAFSGFAPMFSIPVALRNIVTDALIVVGDYPNVRLVNMDGISPETEITLGADVWVVFPVLRQDSWANSSITLSPSTGPYGLAYKKIV